jgi:hypothetical protein
MHLGGCVMVIASAAVFFVAASQFTETFNEIGRLPDIIDTETVDLVANVDSILVGVFAGIGSFVNETRSELMGFVDWLGLNNNATQAEARELYETLLPDYQANFIYRPPTRSPAPSPDPTRTPTPTENLDQDAENAVAVLGNDLNENTDEQSDEDTDDESFIDPGKDSEKAEPLTNYERYAQHYRNEARESPANLDTVKAFYQLEWSLPTGIGAAQAVALQLIGAGVTIRKVHSDTLRQVTTELGKVEADIQRFEGDNLTGELDNLRGNLDSFGGGLRGFVNILDSYQTYVNAGVYGVTALLMSVGFLYAIIYFFNCFLSRCLVTWFPMVGLAFTLLIIFPGIFFSGLFYAFYDLCPIVENIVGDFVGPSFFKNGTDARTVLLCEEELPLLKLMELGFNPDDIMAKAAKSAKDNTGSGVEVDTKELNDKMQGFGQGFSAKDNLTSESLHYQYKKTLGDRLPDTEATYMHELIEGLSLDLVEMQEKFTRVIDFGNEVTPRSNDVSERVAKLFDAFEKNGAAELANITDGLTCRTVRCFYSPVKNAMCADLLAAFAFWTVSTICLSIGLLFLETGLFLRRRSMVNGKVDGENSEDGEIKDLERFQSRTRRRKKKGARTRRSGK